MTACAISCSPLYASLLHCNCPSLCKGGKDVSDKTFHDHLKYHSARLSTAFNDFIATKAAAHLAACNPANVYPFSHSSQGRQHAEDNNLRSKQQWEDTFDMSGDIQDDHHVDATVRSGLDS